jgi:ribonuclease BN (tRNA processing enzyme)
MRAILWGTRGSVARAGGNTVRYGGDTACVEVTASDGSMLILDGGSGLLHVLSRIPPDATRVDILLTHLHMDHIQGLGFFSPLRTTEVDTHIWGPVSTTMRLAERLGRYLSPPLFPVRIRDLKSELHDLGPGRFELGSFQITTDLICHPGPTLGYRIEEGGRALVYMPDHEPALGHRVFPGDPRWTSGIDLARDADLLIHDAQYTDEEYADRVGWGHSTLSQAVAFADQAGAGKLVTFHHDPEHSDDHLDELHRELAARSRLEVVPGTAGSSFTV